MAAWPSCFPERTLLRTLEARGFRYVARLRGNRTLHRLAEPYLKRPPGRPPREGRTWVHELSHRAGSWDTARRVVLVVLERPGEQGELFLDHVLEVPARTTLGKRQGSAWLPADRCRMWHELARAIKVLPLARGSPRAHSRSAA